MKKWDIWSYPYPSKDDPHPFVIISPQAICDSSKLVNALVCQSLRPDMEPKPWHVVLNGSDGLDGRTIVDCRVIHAVRKDGLIGSKSRGSVTVGRRKKIVDLLQRVLLTP